MRVLEVRQKVEEFTEKTESRDTPYGNTFKALIKENKRIYK